MCFFGILSAHPANMIRHCLHSLRAVHVHVCTRVLRESLSMILFRSPPKRERLVSSPESGVLMSCATATARWSDPEFRWPSTVDRRHRQIDDLVRGAHTRVGLYWKLMWKWAVWEQKSNTSRTIRRSADKVRMRMELSFSPEFRVSLLDFYFLEREKERENLS